MAVPMICLLRQQIESIQQLINTKYHLGIHLIKEFTLLQQQLAFGGKGILDTQTERRIREAVVSGLYEGSRGNKALTSCFPFSVITADSFTDATENNISPHPLANYPEAFCLNEYIVLLYYKNDTEYEEDLINRNLCGLPPVVFQEELYNVDEEPIRIVFISDDDFSNFQNLTHSEGASIKLASIAREEFSYALQETFPKVPIRGEYLFLDSEISDQKKQLAAKLLGRVEGWTDVVDRKMTRFKIVQFSIPNRHGKKTNVQMGMIEIQNTDTNLYYRIGFYGNVD